MIPAVIIGVPLICIYMFLRHPRLIWREARKSWDLVNGKGE